MKSATSIPGFKNLLKSGLDLNLDPVVSAFHKLDNIVQKPVLILRYFNF